MKDDINPVHACGLYTNYQPKFPGALTMKISVFAVVCSFISAFTNAAVLTVSKKHVNDVLRGVF